MANYPNWVNIDNGLGACSKRNRRTQKGEMEVEHSGVQSPEDPTWHSPFILPVRVRILVCMCVQAAWCWLRHHFRFPSYFECNNYRRIAAFAIMQICQS